MKNKINGIDYTLKENCPDNPKLGVKYQAISVNEIGDDVEIEKYNYILGDYETETMSKEQYANSIGIFNDSVKNKQSKTITMQRVDEAAALPNNITAKTYGNLWVFEVNLAKTGDAKPRHKHEFDHLHFISNGSALFEIFNDVNEVVFSKEHIAPSWIKIPKDYDHQITATSDNTLGHCIHPMRNNSDEVVDSNYIEDYTFIPN